MNTKKLHTLNKSGATLPLIMLAVVLLSVIGMGLLSLGLKSRIFSIRSASEIAARAAADAGLTKAIYQMNESLKVIPWDSDNLPSATNEQLPNSYAVFSYTVTGSINDGYTIRSTGKSGSSTKTVICTARLRGPLDYAIYTLQQIDLKANTIVDWINYDESDQRLKIGTDSTEEGYIVLKNGTVINGDVLVGFGGDPEVVIDDYGATITGEVYATHEEHDVPDITIPEWLATSPSSGTINDKTPITSGKYDSIKLGNSEVLTIEDDVVLYITGDVDLGNTAEIRIGETNPDASLTLYLGGDLDGKNSSGFNNFTQDSTKLIIYGDDTCTSIDFKNDSNFYGALCTPTANVLLRNSADVYGAIVAESYDQKNSSAFYYDASLRDVDAGDQAVYFAVTDWREE